MQPGTGESDPATTKNGDAGPESTKPRAAEMMATVSDSGPECTEMALC